MNWWRSLLLGVGLAFLAYATASYFLYYELVDINGRCSRHLANRPDSFTDRGNFWPSGFDYAPYQVAAYETVTFPSRDGAVTLSGWWLEATPDAPAVIVAHGFGSCKYAHTVLVPAGMLVAHGFSVLAIDLRDAGDSTWQNGRSALGAEEYLDVLGAWDWLVDEKGLDPAQIGVLGNSVGGRSGLIALAHEPRLTAVFAESPPTDMATYLRDEARRNKFPPFLLWGSLRWAAWHDGVELAAYPVADLLPQFDGRAVEIIHSRDDSFVGVAQTERLALVAKQVGSDLTAVYVSDAGHMQIAALQTATYEQELIRFFEQQLRR